MTKETYILINTPNDFLKYKSSISKKYRQFGTPERYPCAVKSNFWDNINGPYSCDHIFEYPKFVWNKKISVKEK